MRYLSYRPRSVAEMEQYLQQKGIPEAVIEGLIVELIERDYLDDQAFARYWVDQRETFKPRSRLALRHELRQKGLTPAVIEEAVAQVDELEAARRAVSAKADLWAALPQEEFNRKLGQYLQRRGFGYAIINAIIQEFNSNEI